MQFVKMQGAGNDYIYVDCFSQQTPEEPQSLACQISDRHFGVGGDGLVLILPADNADARMRMFNADGSEAEMCGNALRCVAKYLFDHEIVPRDQMRIETGVGVLAVELSIDNGTAQSATINMGRPILAANEIPTTLAEDKVIDVPLEIAGEKLRATCVSMGNPHCIIFVDEITDRHVLSLGPLIEKDPRFPRRTNVEFVQIVSPGVVRQRTWERGSGETLACGTGASAVCVAGVLTGRTEREIVNHLLGGDLKLRWEADDAPVYMTGPAEEVFTGEWSLRPAG